MGLLEPGENGVPAIENMIAEIANVPMAGAQGGSFVNQSDDLVDILLSQLLW